LVETSQTQTADCDGVEQPGRIVGSRELLLLASLDVPLTDLAELTFAGRRHIARRLGLPVLAARRYHGLFGGSPGLPEHAVRMKRSNSGVLLPDASAGA
jgi:hypothetical protein